MCSHYANYETLFAPSCGPVGEFTDIQQDAAGNLAIPAEMRHYSFNVRRLTGEFYAHVFPFDTKFFRKVHTAGALLFSGVHSHLILLQYLLVHVPLARKPIMVFPEISKYWLEDGTLCLFDNRRWRSQDTLTWLSEHGLLSVPQSIRSEIGSLVYNGTKSRASCEPPQKDIILALTKELIEKEDSFFCSWRFSNDIVLAKEGMFFSPKLPCGPCDLVSHSE